MSAFDNAVELPLPFVRSYWAVPGRLLAGCYPGDKDPAEADNKLAGLVRCGVSTIINLMQETERDHSGLPFAAYARRFQELALAQGRSAECLRFPVPDLQIPTVAGMREMLDAIDRVVTRKGIVYVHCWGGRGRTGTVVACYLLRHRLIREGEALAAVKALTEHKRSVFWPTPETTLQREFVSNWRWND